MNTFGNSGSRQVVTDCRRAVRLYISPVFTRENPMAFLAILYGIFCFSLACILRHGQFWHDGHYAIPPVLASFWWFLLYSGFSAISLHYWRQVRLLTAYFLPRQQRAEYLAIHVVAIILILLLAIPPLMTNAPLLNSLSLETISLVLWSAPRETASVNRLRNLATPQGMINTLCFFILLVPRMQNYLFSAPWFIALAIIIFCFGLTLYFLRVPKYSPATERAQRASSGFQPSSAPVRHLGAVLLWRPSWLVRLPLADPVHTGSPIAVAMLVIGATLFFACISQVIMWATDGVAPSLLTTRHRLPELARQSLFLVGIGLSAWMTQRGDWPFLLTLGPCGKKRVFARMAYRLHLQRALQSGLIAGTLIAIVTWLDHRLAFSSALAGGWSCGAFLVGASCLPTLAFLVPKLNRPGVIMALNIAGMIMGMQAATSVIMDTELWWRWFLAPASLLLAILFYYLIPPRLAAQDWPIEPPR